VVLFSPIGKRLDHAAVQRWSDSSGAILVCGRYEGIDQRFIDAHVMSKSAWVILFVRRRSAAMALLDAVARLQPGVLSDAGSHHLDSFNPALDGLLDCPHYTRPKSGWAWRAAGVVVGHHAHIERWRRDQRCD
jgi:tRNA (guanine37-N1)-methyltransferase